MIFGHLPYGVHKVFVPNKNSNKQIICTRDELQKYDGNMNDVIIWINQVNYTYSTVLRHPLSRLKSHFYFHKANKGDPMHKWAKNRDLISWTGFLEDSKSCSTAHIGGTHAKAWWNSDMKLLPKRKDGEYPRADWIVTREHYELARWNLMQMGWVGLFDRLSESVKQLKYFWNLQRTSLSMRNKNKRKPQKSLTKKEKERILEYNQPDLWLYELGVVLFEQQQLVIKYKQMNRL